MTSETEEIVKKIDDLTDIDKAMLVDIILAKLDRPDPELGKIWAEEAFPEDDQGSHFPVSGAQAFACFS